ncbi:MAG: hypothetical protein RL333_3 [Pseudomonadota bacterium]|jgi:hypothetical protein
MRPECRLGYPLAMTTRVMLPDPLGSSADRTLWFEALEPSRLARSHGIRLPRDAYGLVNEKNVD